MKASALMAISSISNKRFDKEPGVIIDYVDLKRLPQFTELNEKITAIFTSSSWWDRHGTDWLILVLSFIGYFSSFFIMSSPNTFIFIIGVVSLGICHFSITVKSAHMAAHNAFCSSKTGNKCLSFIFSDLVGTFSSDVGYSIHVKCHHPHTNIIGLGDSSTFKAPLIPSVLYMFVTPLLLPILTPFVAIKEILTECFSRIACHVIMAYFGLAFHFYLLTTVSELNFLSAVLVVFVSRDVLAIPYIHVNIFQHIGLPMYSQQHRPKKIYQMTSGVLNLPRNPILEFCFGHGIISCHTEHHLFPTLSDNMCLKIQPVVQMFCKKYDLPYHKDTYTGRVWHFFKNYQELMVDAPPVTKFVGLQ